MRRIITYITIAAAVGLFVGCATIDDPAKVRQEHIDSFRAELKEREKERLASPLTLNDCINIALHENYEVKQAVINEQLALTNKEMSFANFLPYVDMTAKLTTPPASAYSAENTLPNSRAASARRVQLMRNAYFSPSR